MRRPLGHPGRSSRRAQFRGWRLSAESRRANGRANHEQSCRRKRISDFPSRCVRPGSAGTRNHTMFWPRNCRPPWRAKRLAFEEKNELSRRQAMLAEEFEHRLVNGLQLIVSLLSLQSRSATNARSGAPIDDCRPSRVRDRTCSSPAAPSRSSGQSRVQGIPSTSVRGPFRPAVPGWKWLRHRGRRTERRNSNDACDSAGLYRQRADHKLDEICRRSHLRFRSTRYPTADRSLSVIDDGPGLPAGFAPLDSKGLGMKIVQSLVKQIGGELQYPAG